MATYVVNTLQLITVDVLGSLSYRINGGFMTELVLIDD